MESPVRTPRLTRRRLLALLGGSAACTSLLAASGSASAETSAHEGHARMDQAVAAVLDQPVRAAAQPATAPLGAIQQAVPSGFSPVNSTLTFGSPTDIAAGWDGTVSAIDGQGAPHVILLWAVTGPVFRFSDAWQLVINTGTTIVTFLMVFLIQNTQNRDTKALHLKLDELLRARVARGSANSWHWKTRTRSSSSWSGTSCLLSAACVLHPRSTPSTAARCGSSATTEPRDHGPYREVERRSRSFEHRNGYVAVRRYSRPQTFPLGKSGQLVVGGAANETFLSTRRSRAEARRKGRTDRAWSPG